MPYDTPEWLDRQRAEVIREAFDECARCRGREFGDCSDQCRYFAITATAKDWDAVQVEAAYKRLRKGRPWQGPTAIGWDETTDELPPEEESSSPDYGILPKASRRGA